MKDYILRATFANDSGRIFVADTRETVNQAFEYHKTSPVMTAALGRTLTGAAIMGSMLKSDDDLLTVTIKGDGPGAGLTVTANNKVQVKGYTYNPVVDIPLKQNGKLDVAGALGFGTMTIIKDLGLKEPYVGQIPLVSGEIAEDLTYYFAKSEQVPSAVSLGVLVDRDYTVKQSGGFIIQLLPSADEEVISKLEEKMKTIKSVTQMLEEGMDCEQILNETVGDMEPKILDRIPVEYYCNCDRERVEKALISVGRKELEDILATDKQATLHCHFCNKDYHFSEEDIKNILERQ
ncbi:MAG: Hsp33 family molecular chaperone HslO [Firmicutes bacterium]|nr:Hsp33 family molecular chaperone HslO [Bacillota bacterium]